MTFSSAGNGAQTLPGMTITADAPSSGKPPAWLWLLVAAAVGYVLRGGR